MKLQYLGTAAAEAIPALFCQCDLCTQARKLKGKDIRGRSGMVIDDSLLVDFPPDMYMHSLRFGIDLAKIDDILITHSHSDHFDPCQIMMRMPGCFCHIKDGKQTVNVYGNTTTGAVLKEIEKYEFGEEIDFVKYSSVTKFNTYQIGNFMVTPMPALHKLDEDAYIYLIKREGKTILYGNDTGIFFDEVFEYLKKSKTYIDLVSFDCTFGKDPDGGNHMGMPDNDKVRARLASQGNVDEKTKYFVTHFSHNCHQNHQQLCFEARKYGFEVAYDGLIIEV